MSFYNWYNHLSQEGKKYGYLVNGSKSWLTVKSGVLTDEAKRVFGDEVNVTTEGQRHSVIGSQEFKDQNCREKILRCKGELEALSEIARSQPHAAYTVFSKGYKSKWFEDYVDPIQEAIDDLLLSTLFGQTEPLPGDLRQLVTLTPDQRGLGVPDLRIEAPQQFAVSTLITAPHVDSTNTQSMFMVAGENSTEKLKRQHQALKTAPVKSRMESIDSTLPSDLLWSKETSTFFKKQEEEKKRKYQQRVLDVEMGSFTPLVLGTNGGMGADCNRFLKRIAEKLSEKNYIARLQYTLCILYLIQMTLMPYCLSTPLMHSTHSTEQLHCTTSGFCVL